MPQELARQWFIPGDGIDRHVISADIQRYLGNDATVRPGRGTGQNEGVDGYWIKGYRNLTSAMISDLRADSAKWRQEQRATGTRGSGSPLISQLAGFTVPDPFLDYSDSRTYEQGAASQSHRRNAESPAVDTAYGVLPNSRGGRGNQVDAMQIDPPSSSTDRSRYGQQPTSSRGGYPPDNGAFPSSGRDRFPDGGRPPQQYPQDQSMTDAYGRVPASQPFGQDPRYPGNFPSKDPSQPGFPRDNYYVPVTSGYGQPPVMAPTRPEQPQYPAGPYGQPTEPQRDPRGVRGDPRDPRYGQPDYSNDPSRYYPSPSTTVASVGSRDPISSPPVTSPYGQMQQQYDQYGRPIPQPQAPYGGVPDPGYPSTRDPTYGRQPTAPSSHDRERERDSNARRRRLH